MRTDSHLWGEGEVRMAFLKWYASLEHDKGGRAELRRAEDPSEAMFVRAFHRLRASLAAAAPKAVLERSDRLDRLAAIACLAARTKEHVSLARERGEHTLAALFARPAEGSSRPRVSPARFRRLLKTEDLSDLTRQLRRVLTLLDDRIDLLELADAIYQWGHDRTRQKWAYDYYRALPAETGAAGEPARAKGA